MKKALEDLGLKMRVVDASEEFYNGTTQIQHKDGAKETEKLNKTTNSEEKRKIIGDTFMRIAQREVATLGLVVEDVFLGIVEKKMNRFVVLTFSFIKLKVLFVQI